MINLRFRKVKVCEDCKKPCEDDYVFLSTANSRIVCLCSEHAKKVCETCKKFNIPVSIY